MKTQMASENSDNTMFENELYIFGAKSTAIGVIRAIKVLYTECEIKACIVSSLEDNPNEVDGIPVVELESIDTEFGLKEKEDITILVATPIFVQDEIKETLNARGFNHVILLDSEMEEKLMEAYFGAKGMFKPMKELPSEMENVQIRVYKVKSYFDSILKNAQHDEIWVKDIQAGAILAPRIICDTVDDVGDNISGRNPLYSELTAVYSMWRGNLLNDLADEDYCGVFHYRRALDVNGSDLKRCKAANVDVVLPYPMLYLPNAKEHHTRYTNEAEWEMLLQAVEELSPEYYADYEKIFGMQYMYNYNMLVAKKKVFMDYCARMFPILFRTEQLCEQADFTPRKRYLAYFAENMTNWYFMHNQDKLNIVHTGRMLRG